MKRGIYLTIVLIIGIAVLSYLSSHSRGLVSPLNYPIGLNPNVSYENYEILSVSEADLTSGTTLDLNKMQVLSFYLNNQEYYLSINEINTLLKRAGLSLNNQKFYLETLSLKKIDLNNDLNYDLEIKVNSIKENSLEIFIMKINEPTTISDSVDIKINNAITDVSKKYTLQFNLVIIFLVVLLLIIGIYLMKVYLIPFIKYKNATARQKPTDALLYLFSQYQDSRKKGNLEESMRLFSRIKHLYSHMSESEKRIYNSRIRNIEKSL